MEPHVALNVAELHALRTQPTAVPVNDAIFHLTGTGVIECLQGVLTNDIVRAGPDALIWGAVLTPKGMIISDLWVRRRGNEAWVIVPGIMRETMQQLFVRSFPPRLAKARDVSDSVSLFWLIGEYPPAFADADLARPSGPAPFGAMLLTSDSARDSARLRDAGWRIGSSGIVDAVRLFGGWPTVGREIDDKTLPQEVRFDELEGVKYDKGCYTGQETVARLHFRGHANRVLRGLTWADGSSPDAPEVMAAERQVGTIRTLCHVETQSIGLALLRREVQPGDEVVAGGAAARVIELPFDLHAIVPS